MTFVITFGVLFFVDLLLGSFVENTTLLYEHYNSYASTLLIGGFILSSLAFRDLGNPLKRYHYLTLPASTFEKFIGMWLLTSVGWIFLYTLTYTVYTVVVNPIGHLLFSHVTFQAFEPWGEFPRQAMKFYLVLQGIFLVGAVYFRGYVLPKTLFTLILFGVAVGTLTYFIMADVFLADHECTSEECSLLVEMEGHQAWKVAQGLFWWGLAPLCWVIAFLGLKEQEV